VLRGEHAVPQSASVTRMPMGKWSANPFSSTGLPIPPNGRGLGNRPVLTAPGKRTISTVSGLARIGLMRAYASLATQLRGFHHLVHPDNCAAIEPSEDLGGGGGNWNAGTVVFGGDHGEDLDEIENYLAG
jgi:hypothetical protein